LNPSQPRVIVEKAQTRASSAQTQFPRRTYSANGKRLGAVYPSLQRALPHLYRLSVSPHPKQWRCRALPSLSLRQAGSPLQFCHMKEKSHGCECNGTDWVLGDDRSQIGSVRLGRSGRDCRVPGNDKWVFLKHCCFAVSSEGTKQRIAPLPLSLLRVCNVGSPKQHGPSGRLRTFLAAGFLIADTAVESF
jgi:hypothetical protein